MRKDQRANLNASSLLYLLDCIKILLSKLFTWELYPSPSVIINCKHLMHIYQHFNLFYFSFIFSNYSIMEKEKMHKICSFRNPRGIPFPLSQISNVTSYIRIWTGQGEGTPKKFLFHFTKELFKPLPKNPSFITSCQTLWCAIDNPFLNVQFYALCFCK